MIDRTGELAPILSIDTCTGSGSASVCVSDGRVFVTDSLDEGSGRINPVLTIPDLLEQAGIGIRDVSTIIVTRGPGSYTGMRVGLSFVKGLQASFAPSVYSLTTFEALSEIVGDDTGSFLFVIPAGRGEYAGHWFSSSSKAGRVRAEGGIGIYGVKDLESILAKGKAQRVLSVPITSKASNRRDPLTPSGVEHLNGSIVAELARTFILAADDLEERKGLLDPLYAREFISGSS